MVQSLEIFAVTILVTSVHIRPFNHRFHLWKMSAVKMNTFGFGCHIQYFYGYILYISR